MHKKYKVVKFSTNFETNEHNRTTIYKNLTLEQAREICNDPETSSRTAKNKKGADNITKAWFYGFTEM